MSKIERAEVLVTSPGRNFVTLRITTSDGVTGLGDATLNGRELAVAGYLREHVVPLLIGKDPARIEDMWQYLYRGAYWRRGPVTMTSIAAVDTALWDIKGKVAGLPVYQLLGGRSRDGVMVYGHASGADVPSLLDDVARFRELGYRAIRAQAAVPDIGGSYGVRKGTIYEPAATALPDEQPWSTEAYLDFAPALPGGGPRAASASASTCCTTCTTGSPRWRPPSSASGWRSAGCSGWRTRPRRRTRRRSG